MSARSLYDWLTGGETPSVDPFDRHVFACTVAIAAAEGPLANGLGLPLPAIEQLMRRYFPRAVELLGGERPLDPATDQIEEPDLRRLLLDNRTLPTVDSEWLAAIVARRSQRPNHLWQDLGLFSRADLSRLLTRHFEPLAARNTGDMKWKKFFYRMLCRQEGIVICKAPHCEVCTDFAICFGGEDGMSLLAGNQAA